MTLNPTRLAPFVVLAMLAAGCSSEGPKTYDFSHTDDGTGSGGGGSGGNDGSGSTTGTTSTGSGPSTSTAATTGAGSGGSVPEVGSFDVSLDDAAPATELMAGTGVTVTVTPDMGFTGTVNLFVTGLPSEVHASFDDASPTVTGGAALANLSIDADSTAMPGDYPFTLKAMSVSGAIQSEITGTLTVEPSITLHIPVDVLSMGTVSNPYTTAYGPYPINVNAGGQPISIYFMNDDNIPHEIHGNDPFGHDDAEIPAHSMDSKVRTLGSGTYDWYLHDQGNAATPGQMVIQ